MKQRVTRCSYIEDFLEAAKLLKANSAGVFVQVRMQSLMKDEISNRECFVNFHMASKPVRQPG